MYIDGDFPTKGKCKYHCSPTCHPGQIDEDKWHYGCTHLAWPANKAGDFCPFVECGGNVKNCELKNTKCLKRYISGKKRSFNYTHTKLEKIRSELQDAIALS